MIKQEQLQYCIDNILPFIKKNCVLDNLSRMNWIQRVVFPLKDCTSLGSWKYAAGVTKGVIILNDMDIVIKIPFALNEGDPNENSYYTSEYSSDSWGSEDDESCETWFCSASTPGYNSENNWDYCEQEVARYNFAKVAHTEQFFAEEVLIGYVDNIYPIYAQEKAVTYEDMMRYRNWGRISEEEFKMITDLQDSTGIYLSENWVRDFLECWGKNAFYTFADFCNEYWISDLHDGNLGYINGRPCLIDYSSYED